MSNVKKLPKSVLDEAKEEFDKEQRHKAVSKIKIKLKEKASAELTLKNIERELEDLMEQIEQGDIE